MIGTTYCNPEDVAMNILLKKNDWFHGIPDIQLIGDEGKFGTLRFDFGDEIVRMNLFIKDREAILDAAHHAVHNFDEMIKNILSVWRDSITTDKIMEAIEQYERDNRNIAGRVS